MTGEGGERDFGWGEALDLTSLPEEELRAALARFVAEEREISYRRRVLQGRIDLVRTELVRRGGFGLSHEDLVRVLMDEGGGGASSATTRESDPDAPDAPSEGASGARRTP